MKPFCSRLLFTSAALLLSALTPASAQACWTAGPVTLESYTVDAQTWGSGTQGTGTNNTNNTQNAFSESSAQDGAVDGLPDSASHGITVSVERCYIKDSGCSDSLEVAVVLNANIAHSNSVNGYGATRFLGEAYASALGVTHAANVSVQTGASGSWNTNQPALEVFTTLTATTCIGANLRAYGSCESQLTGQPLGGGGVVQSAIDTASSVGYVP